MKENESGTTIAWLLDNAHVGDDGRIQELTNDLSTKIEVLIATYNNERTDVTENEKNRKLRLVSIQIATKKFHQINLYFVWNIVVTKGKKEI